MKNTVNFISICKLCLILHDKLALQHTRRNDYGKNYLLDITKSYKIMRIQKRVGKERMRTEYNQS